MTLAHAVDVVAHFAPLQECLPNPEALEAIEPPIVSWLVSYRGTTWSNVPLGGISPRKMPRSTVTQVDRTV